MAQDIINPKDGQITNQDNTVTNVSTDTNNKDSQQENEKSKPDDVLITTVTPYNENGDPGPPSEKPAVDKGETLSDNTTF